MLIRVWLLALLTVFGSLNVLAQGKDTRAFRPAPIRAAWPWR